MILSCGGCGSRAGKPRSDELSTEEALDVVAQLAAMGTREVTLIGGEAYLREDWHLIARAIVDHGMRASMTTAGRGMTRERAELAKAVRSLRRVGLHRRPRRRRTTRSAVSAERSILRSRPSATCATPA